MFNYYLHSNALTEECPNIFVQANSTRANVRMYTYRKFTPRGTFKPPYTMRSIYASIKPQKFKPPYTIHLLNVGERQSRDYPTDQLSMNYTFKLDSHPEVSE